MASPYLRAPDSSLHIEQFDVEDQRGIWRDDAAGPAGPVTEFGRDDERALAADLHGRHTFIPAADDLTPADGELKWLATIERAVELFALGAAFVEPAGVVHDADLTGLRCCARAHLGVGDLQARWRSYGGAGGLGHCGGRVNDREGAGQCCNDECRRGACKSESSH